MEIKPPDQDNVAARKRAAAQAAVAEIEDGMLIGLGTGSTTNFAIDALRKRIAEGLTVCAVATSLATNRLAAAAGVPMRSFDHLARLDLAIDGADEVDPQLRAIKGKGGAMLREKVVAAAAARTIIVVDDGKRVATLGSKALPVEVLPFAASFVSNRIESLGAAVSQRTAEGAPYRTDQDNVVLDCQFGAIGDLQALATALAAIPGLLGHGLFLDEIDAVYVGVSDGVIQLARDSQ